MEPPPSTFNRDRDVATGRTRTGNLLNAIETLSSLSYGPIQIRRELWSDGDSHPDPCSASAEFSWLNYRPRFVVAGREGIEPSLRVLEARPVTMTLRPVSSLSASYGN